jgi:hypothetical protein
MSSFGTRLDEIVRAFTSDLIRVVDGEARKNEADRKLAEVQAVPIESMQRNSRVPASQGGVLGVRLVTTFRHPERNRYRVVLTRFAPDSSTPSPPPHPRPSEHR